MPTQKKIDQVEEIKGKFQEAGACWFVDACGLTVKEVQQLRRNIREAGGQMKVYKNTLTARAIAELGYPEIPEVLAGPTAFVFAGEDVAAPAKAVKDFAKENEVLEIKGGLMDGAFLTPAEVEAVASLPSKEVLLAQIAGAISGVARGLATTINGVPSGLAQCIKQVSEQKAA